MNHREPDPLQSGEIISTIVQHHFCRLIPTQFVFWIVALGLLVSTSGCGLSKRMVMDPPASKEQKLLWHLPSPVDTGEPLGTLLRIEDRNGKVICEAGFNWSFSSRVSGPNRTLQLWCQSRHKPTIQDLGIPAKDSRRMSLALLSGKVIELTTNRLLVDGHWTTADPLTKKAGLHGSVSRHQAGAAASYSGLTQSIQRIGNLDMRFVYWQEHQPSLVILGENTVAEAPIDLAAGLFAYGYIWLSPINGGELWRCPFNPDRDKHCGPMEKLSYPGGSAYALAAWEGAVWIADSHGKLWQTQVSGNLNDTIRLSFDSRQLDPAFPGEFYAFAVFGNSLIAGHYPSGQLVQLKSDDIKEHKWRPFGPALGRPTPSTNPLTMSEIEVQSLLVHAGKLWAGVYPWGELYPILPSGELLGSPYRLFQGARENVPPFPYSDRLLRAAVRIAPGSTGSCSFDGDFAAFLVWGGENEGFVRDCLDQLGGYISKTDWGQRLPSQTLDASGLYLATGNRMNHSWLGTRDRSIITESELEDYGRIWRLTSPGIAAMPFDWPKSGRYEMRISITKDGKVRMTESSGQSLQSAPDTYPQTACMRIGTGSFGNSPGRLVISGEPLPACP